MGDERKRVLICGDRSFAAQGLRELLSARGFDVATFTRGTLNRAGPFVTGPVMTIHKNPYLTGRFDAVINYILLQGESVEDNIRYVEALAGFCRERSIRHLIHISSCSVYKNGARLVTETARV